MPETFEPLHESFSTADAEAPGLVFEQGSLHVRFRDWQARDVNITFRDSVAFSWDEGDAAVSNDHRDDVSYIVVGSDWVTRHLDGGSIMVKERYRHYKLCFNAIGVLQVIATGLDVLAQPLAVED